LTPPRDPLPFFVGVGRSGNTLLRSIFNAHPDLAVVNVSRFVVWLADHRARYEREAFDTPRFLADLLDNPSARQWLIENGRRRLATDYSREAVRQQLLDVIRSVQPAKSAPVAVMVDGAVRPA
jgi:hypothetical protein